MIRHTLVIEELWQRKGELLTGCAAVALGIAVLVAARTITVSSRDALRVQMHQLGANVLVLPEAQEAADYYLADLGTEVMPEEHAHRLHASEIAEHVHNMAARLSARVRTGDAEIILTGVLPKSELRQRPRWAAVTPFARASGAPEEGEPSGAEHGDERASEGVPAPRLTVDALALSHVIVGSEAARLAEVIPGDTLDIRGRRFWVKQVLKPTGTVDDVRVFAHLHTVQELLGKPGVINVIEIVGCGCTTDLRDLSKRIERLLPGTRAVTIRHIERTQIGVVRTMQGFAVVFLVVVALTGGGTIANYFAGNAHARKRELGTLLALGATPGHLARLFAEKAVLLGVAGGLMGFLAGTALATHLGPRLFHVSTRAQPGIALWAVGFAVALALAFSVVPVWRYVTLEPADLLAEE